MKTISKHIQEKMEFHQDRINLKKLLKSFQS
uniref:Uncharacterized protein n=1 Tax=Arundo donax TaxID=35708 RepID=A0A0A9E395_ARUDO